MNKSKSRISLYTWGQISVLVIALLLRLIHLNGSFWLDESAQALESARPLDQQLHIQNDFQPPLYHLIVHLFMQAGTAEWWLRLSSILPGLITIWFTILLGKKLFNKDVGLTAGILLATSQFHLFYSQELRPYSLAAMWALISIYLFYEFIQNKRYIKPLLIVALTAGMYTMYVFPLILVTMGLVTAVWYRSKLFDLLKVMGIVVLLFLPWLPSFLTQLNIGIAFANESALWSSIVSPPLWKMIPLVFTKFLLGRIPVDFVAKDIIYIASLLALTLSLFKRGVTSFKYSKEILVWFLAPIFLAFLISIKVPVLDPKRVLFALPALAILLASGIGKGIRSAAALAVLLTVNMIGVSMYTTETAVQREPWRQAVYEVEQSSNPSDVVMFTFDAPFAPWVWYQTKDLRTISIKNPPLELVNLTMLDQKVGEANNVYVFDYLHELTDPNQILLTSLEEIGFKETQSIQYDGIGKIRLFERVIPIASRL